MRATADSRSLPAQEAEKVRKSRLLLLKATTKCSSLASIKHSGNLAFDDIVEVARKMRFKSMAKELSGTVKEMLGTGLFLDCFLPYRY